MIALTQEPATPDDAAFGSAFPMTRRLLARPEARAAVLYSARRRDLDRYRSLTDLLFCESFPEWREVCFRYYHGRGPDLSNDLLASPRLLWAYDVVLRYGMLEICLAVYQRTLRLPWSAVLAHFRYWLRYVA